MRRVLRILAPIALVPITALVAIDEDIRAMFRRLYQVQERRRLKWPPN